MVDKIKKGHKLKGNGKASFSMSKNGKLKKSGDKKQSKEQYPKELTSELKYRLYEAAVQDPDQQVRQFRHCFESFYDHTPTVLREDFCGTFLISTEWVKQGKEFSALGLDLSKEPLEHGRTFNMPRLTEEEKKRIAIFEEDVRTVTPQKADVIAACNFSFFCLHKRTELLDYFRAARKSLKKEGILVLEMAGGPGFISNPFKETRKITYPDGPREGKKWFDYTWKHVSFEPISRNGHYSINFKMKDGTRYEDAFYYDWRVYTIPETCDALIDAGFSEAHVFWDFDEEAEAGENICELAERGEDDDTWIVYVVGVR